MIRIKILLLFVIALTNILGATQARVQAEEATTWNTSAQLKRQTIAIAGTLRCPMAINQSLHDSQSPIANELKAEIYLQLEQGKTPDEIIDFMVARYGERIRYMPNLSVGTALLFFAPLGLLAVVISWYLMQVRRRAPIHSLQEQ